MHIQRVHKKTPPPKYNGVVLANIVGILTIEFSRYLYVVCKNWWKFNEKIVFYYMFSSTRPKHKFRDNTDSCTFTVISNEAV